MTDGMMRLGEQMMRMTGKLCEPKYIEYGHEALDYGDSYRFCIAVKAGCYYYARVYVYNAGTYMDEDRLKSHALFDFWRHIGAA